MTLRTTALAGMIIGVALQAPLRAAPPEFGPNDIGYIANSMGFEPMSRPVRNGPYFALRAIDPYDVEVRLVIDSRTGRVVSARPVMTAAAPAYGRPQVYPPGPPGHYAPVYGSPGYHGPAMPPVARPHVSKPQAPLPRPRPDATAKVSPAPAAEPPAPQAQPEPAPAPQAPPEAKPEPAPTPAAAPEAKPESPAEAKPN